MADTNLAEAFRADLLPHYVAITRAGKVAKEEARRVLMAAGLG